MEDICVELCQISGNNKDKNNLLKYSRIIYVPITEIEYPLNERQAHLDETLSVPLDINAVSNYEKLLISYSIDFGAVVFGDIAKIVWAGYVTVNKTFTDEDRKDEDYYDTLVKKLDENIGNELEQYQTAFGIDDELLKSAIHLGLEGKTLTPPPVIFEYNRSYTVDEKGMIYINEEDIVAKKIIDLLMDRLEILVPKICCSSFSDFGNKVLI